jgi:hypothetical protein
MVEDFTNIENPGPFLDHITSNLKKEDVLKLCANIQNEDLDGFERFKCYLISQWFLSKFGRGSFVKEVTTKGDINTTLFQCFRFLYYGKLFKIDLELFKLFEETHNEIVLRRLPFDTILIPCNINILNNRLNIFAILISEVFVVPRNENELCVRIFGIDEGDKSEFWKSFFISEKGIEYEDKENNYEDKENNYVDNYEGDSNPIPVDIFSDEESREIENKISLFVINFLDFYHHPDVEKRIIISENNKKRMKRGKFPNPDTVILTLKGKLHEYVYNILPNLNSLSGKPFWVRGHYCHYRNKERFKQIYNKTENELKRDGYQIEDGLISRFIVAYIKNRKSNLPVKTKTYRIKK